MKIKRVKAEKIYNSRKEPTICIFVETENGSFSASAPGGKSKGKYETPSYKESLEKDIISVNNYSKKLDKIELVEFKDLEKVEKIVELGANSLFALEAALLKAMAAKYRYPVWEFLNDRARKFPVPVGNCIGGGLHTRKTLGKKPNFQEFLILPRARNFSDSVFLMNKAWEICGDRLRLRRARGKLNDEGAWSTSLNDENALEVMQETSEELKLESDKKIGIGIDVAASEFYTGFVYDYENPRKALNHIGQINYISELTDKFLISYIEDPLNEESFEDFGLLRESITRTHSCLIVGDDLTVTNIERLKKALQKRSINSIIVKPNQNGSLLEVKRIIDFAKKYNIATIMSHRSGETMDNILADLAFGFQCDLIKTGIHGKEREVKLNRLIQIEKSLG